MAIKSLSWFQGYSGRDIHVVRQGTQAAGVNNETRPLTPMIKAETTDGTTPVINPAYSSTLPSAPPAGVNYGLTFNGATGVVTVVPTDPPLVGVPQGIQVRNFIITATQEAKTLDIRVHVHSKTLEAVLSPSTLTVRSDDEKPQFSILAAFDDGTAADISYHPGMLWRSTGTNFTIEADTGIITVTPGATSGGGTVTVDLPPELGGLSPSATLTILPPWTSINATALWLGGPGVSKRDQPGVRNMLILPEGFEVNEQNDFEFLAQGFVDGLTRSGGGVRPFDLLKNNFNFYSAWLPPPTPPPPGEGGTTCLATIARVQRSETDPTDPKKKITVLRGIPIQFPLKPTGPAGTVTSLPQLIYAAGLPVKTDPKVNAATYTTLWANLLGPNKVVFASSVTTAKRNTIVREWLELKERLVDYDKNTLFSIAHGGRARVDDQIAVTETLAGFHPRRGARAGNQGGGRMAINGMISRIKAESEINPPNLEPIGDLWTAAAKRNNNYVIFMCRSAKSVGTRFSMLVTSPPPSEFVEQLGISLTDDPAPLVIARPSSAFPLLKAVTKKLSAMGTADAAHEIGHLFHLGDEYSQIIGTYPDADVPALETRWWNLQGEISITPPGGGLPNTALIKWKWPKNPKAAVLLGPLTGTYVAKVKPGQAAIFKAGDKVAIRTTPLLPFRLPLTEYEVTGKPNVRNDTISLTLKSGAPSLGGAGQILYAFTRGPADVDGDTVVTIIHRDVLASMKAKGALTRSAAGAACAVGGSEPGENGGVQLPKNAPKGLHKYASQLLGLYDAGDQYRCGVFHATGDCIMRSTNGRTVFKFCHVCRYILVEQFAPEMHSVIDKDYNLFYPKK